MSDDEAGTPPPTKREIRRSLDAWHITTTLPTADDWAFLAREFILCTLPHRNPGNVPVWSRTNGNLTLGIRPGLNFKTGKSYGYPYGTIPRLLLAWVTTEALRTGSRRLELGGRLSDFMMKLGLNPTNGGTGAKRSDAHRLRDQMQRLFRATIGFDYSRANDARSGNTWLDMQIAPEGILWWDEKAPEQAALWGSWIELGDKFYQAITSEPLPLDVRVLKHIKQSPLAIDLYTILNREAYRAHRDGESRFLAWEWLRAQIGNEYGELGEFRRHALPHIKAILVVAPNLFLRQERGRKGQKSGLVISNLSTPSIPPKD